MQDIYDRSVTLHIMSNASNVSVGTSVIYVLVYSMSMADGKRQKCWWWSAVISNRNFIDLAIKTFIN